MTQYIDLPPGQGDEIETPPDLFRNISERWRIMWDAAATPVNSLCGPIVDCLVADWKTVVGPRGVVFLNPPYSNPTPFLRAAVTSGVPTVALLKADHTTSWWQTWVEGRGVVMPLTRRVRFYYRGHPLRQTAAFPSVLVFYDAGLRTWRG